MLDRNLKQLNSYFNSWKRTLLESYLEIFLKMEFGEVKSSIFLTSY